MRRIRDIDEVWVGVRVCWFSGYTYLNGKPEGRKYGNVERVMPDSFIVRWDDDSLPSFLRYFATDPVYLVENGIQRAIKRL